MSPDANLFQDESKLNPNQSPFSTSKDPRSLWDAPLELSKNWNPMWPSLKLRLVTSKSCWRRTLSNGISSKKNIESPKNHLTTNLARMISRSNIHSKCRKVADPRDGSQHTSSKDKTAQSPEDPQSVHLIGFQPRIFLHLMCAAECCVGPCVDLLLGAGFQPRIFLHLMCAAECCVFPSVDLLLGAGFQHRICLLLMLAADCCCPALNQ
ncbi:unnamed protein product [Prunus armeniaca]|uniref:Uncharacterized protein n=1 Tax=Prunus armeniaca TaxID=36596 RepID=A0A6J5XKK3_PRUAR|nr:unnamed protein product [Prunus armeniaca]